MKAYTNKRTYTHFKRYCKSLNLRNDPALMADYRKAHAPGAVWPEITRGMYDVGILDMEIYLIGNRLFMIMDTVPEFDHERDMARLADMPRQGEWEKTMSRFQQSEAGDRADEKWQLMERIYKIGL
ncbi:MAG: L-rhamnose mutarotase [Bacteroidetes bacterium]|nr:MAG: L-rhamnose mutarotase [Bacteroidota bacterium]